MTAPDHRLIERMMHARIELQAGAGAHMTPHRFRISPACEQELAGEFHYRAPSDTGMYPGRIAGVPYQVDPALTGTDWRLEPIPVEGSAISQ